MEVLGMNFDEPIEKIANYVASEQKFSSEAYHLARLCLMDSLACMFLAERFPDCKRLLGPITEHDFVDDGARVPGTHYELNPIEAAFNISTAIRWLDYNDTWLAKEWGHPSDNIGAILAVADYESRLAHDKGATPFTMHDVLTAMVKAYEIQGILALDNSFNSIGLDHVILVKLASTAVVTKLLGGNKEKIANAISQVFVDGNPLRTYRHMPNSGNRKSWAAGDAASRAVWLAQITMRGEHGYPNALSAKDWGFNDVRLGGKSLDMSHELGNYVIENILFKAQFPSEYHGQTAVEAALKLYPQVVQKWDDISKITIRTHESAMRIINKNGNLQSPADRDHCLQYMVAAALSFGELRADHYGEHFAADPRINPLREKMKVIEDKNFSKDYLDPSKRSVANALQIHFHDGKTTDEVLVEYPIGHPKRRKEAMEALSKKFHTAAMTHFPADQYQKILTVLDDQKTLEKMPVDEFMQLLMRMK